jgi:hypothetical protein
MTNAPAKVAPKAAPKAGQKTPPKPKGMKTQSLILGVILAVCAVRMMPTTIIVVVGMLPTAVAYFVDSSREKTLGPVVFCLNFAGVLPALLKLWSQGQTMSAAMDLITQPFMLAIMLFPAACGWLLYAYMPYLVIGIVKRKAEARIKTLEKYQQDLIDQWGQIVTGNAVKPEKEKEAI